MTARRAILRPAVMHSPAGPAAAKAPSGQLTSGTSGLFALLAGTLPFLLGRVLWTPTPGGNVQGPSLSQHLFMRETGIPEPFCGATRAFILAARGDPRFLDYNPAWVFVALVLVGWGLLALGRGISGRPTLDPWSTRLHRWVAQRPAGALVPVSAVLLAAWAVALLNAATIRGI